MSRIGSGQVVAQQKAGNNIYTAMALVAFVSLAVAVGFVWKTNVELTHDEQAKDRNFTNPFFMIDRDNPARPAN